MDNFLNYVLYFFLYSVIGWVGETIYCSIGEKKFVNRGFLTGPLCPIYGTGATVFGVCLMPFYEKYGYSKWYIILLVIVLGMILADIVEFLTSLIMEKLFNARWWDYSNEKFNIQGRICLKHTLYWGIATGIFIYIVHPFVTSQVQKLITPHQRNQILIMILIVFAFDLFFAVKGAFDIRKFMTKLNKLYDSVSETASEIKSNVQQKYEDIHDNVEKRGYKFAVWAADVSRQISEFEQHLKALGSSKNEEGKTGNKNAKRLYSNMDSIGRTAKEKMDSVKSIISELQNSAVIKNESNDEEQSDSEKNNGEN